MSESESTKGTGLPRAAAHAQLDAFGHLPAGAGDVGPVARTTDPPTSHRAARSAARGLTLAQLAVLDVFRYMHRDGRVMVHEELIKRFHARRSRLSSYAWYPDLTESSVRTRCKELVTLGYVQHVDDAGTNERGRKCARWACTPAGGAFDVDAARARLRA